MESNIAAVTEALRDLLGPMLHWHADSCWHWHGYYIEQDGTIDTDGATMIPPADMDKLHAASTLVRRMTEAGNG